MRTVGSVVLVAVAAVLLLPGAAVAQGEDTDFLVTPSADADVAAQGGYFLLEAEPGEVVTQSVDVRNDSTRRLDLQLAAVDAVTGPLGGASYALESDEASRTGTWIELDRTSLSLEPGASAVVPFTVTVPEEVSSTGEHLAGISVGPETDTASTTGNGDDGVSVDIRTRRVVAVQVNLPGDAEPELVINGVTPSARPDGLYLEVDIEHTGTALTKGTGVVTLPEDEFEREFSIDTFVPATAIAYPVKWDPESPDGAHPVEVEIQYADKVARWEGEVTVGEEVLEELAEREVGGTNDTADTGAPSALLLAAVGLGVLVLLLLVGLLVYGRRRSNARRRSHRG
jgi:hypothetical protein